MKSNREKTGKQNRKQLSELGVKEIFTFEKLLGAHKKARLGKGGKRDMIQFELDLAANLWQLHKELHGGSYKTGGYHSFKITEPKEREIEALSYKDRVVQHVLCDNLLAPYMEQRLIYDNAACQKGKGTHFALRRLKKFLTDYVRKTGHGKNETGEKQKKPDTLCEDGRQGYFLKADIRKFFANIDHETLKDKLARENFTPEIYRLLCDIIDSHNKESGKGLPIGNQTSQIFALYYLDEIDRYIKERAQIKYYSRYMDDMVLVHQSKNKLKQTLEGMKQIAKKLKLEFNEKTQITPLKQGIDYIGWHFYITATGKTIMRLRTQAKKRIYRKIKAIKKEQRQGKTTAKKIRQSEAAWAGHLKHGNARQLMQNIKHKIEA